MPKILNPRSEQHVLPEDGGDWTPLPGKLSFDASSSSAHLHWRISNAFLAVIAILSLGFVFVIPPFQSSDGHGHFIRAYEISRGHFIGNASPTLPGPIAAFIEHFPERLEDEGHVQTLIREELARPPESNEERPLHPIGRHFQYLSWSTIGANLYSPVTYLPAVAGVAAGRLLALPPLGLMYAARLANLAVFLLALVAAFRLAPDSRILIAAIALTPMTLQQAIAVSGDATLISISLLGFALILRTRQKLLSRRLLTGLATLFPLWAICKPSPWTFAVALLIGPACFTSSKRRFTYLAIVWAAMVVAVLGWQQASAQSTREFREARQTAGIDVSANVTYAVHHPIGFASAVATATTHNLPNILRQFWGAFGWSGFSGPWPLRWVYLLLILFVAATEQLQLPLTRTERLWATASFLCGVTFVCAIVHLTDGGPCPGGAGLCFEKSAGVQGRYFTPFVLFGLLLLKREWTVLSRQRLALTVLITGAAQGLFVLALVAKRFYA